MAVFDADTGLPVALLLDNGFLTDIRTGAAGAVAAERPGAARDRDGRRARIRPAGAPPGPLPARGARLLAHRRVEPRSARTSTPTARDARRGVRRAPRRRRRRRSAATPTSLITATPSRAPLVQRRVAAARASTSPRSDPIRRASRSSTPACLARADLLVVDRLTQCAAFGELRHALDAGLLRADRSTRSSAKSSPACKPGRTTRAATHHRRSHRRRLPGHGDRQLRDLGNRVENREIGDAEI